MAAKALEESVTATMSFTASGNIIYRNCDGFWTFFLPEVQFKMPGAEAVDGRNVKIVAYDIKGNKPSASKARSRKRK